MNIVNNLYVINKYIYTHIQIYTDPLLFNMIYVFICVHMFIYVCVCVCLCGIPNTILVFCLQSEIGV